MMTLQQIRKVSLENSKLNKLSNVYYKRNKINIGRSAIRKQISSRHQNINGCYLLMLM